MKAGLTLFLLIAGYVKPSSLNRQKTFFFSVILIKQCGGVIYYSYQVRPILYSSRSAQGQQKRKSLFWNYLDYASVRTAAHPHRI
jgi:hypothetical protein